MLRSSRGSSLFSCVQLDFHSRGRSKRLFADSGCFRINMMNRWLELLSCYRFLDCGALVQLISSCSLAYAGFVTDQLKITRCSFPRFSKLAKDLVLLCLVSGRTQFKPLNPPFFRQTPAPSRLFEAFFIWRRERTLSDYFGAIPRPATPE